MTIEFQDMSGLVGQLTHVLYKTKRIQQMSETYGMRSLFSSTFNMYVEVATDNDGTTKECEPLECC